MQELIFGFFGGVALLVLGIDMLGDGLERAAGQAMRKILNTLTSSLWRGIAVGTLLTAIIQSSSAMTVMVVGFANAGMMTLEQALGIIYGANIGTTVSTQLLRLSITDYAMPIMGVGVAIKMITKNERARNFGHALIGFGMIFLGLSTLGTGSEVLTSDPAIRQAIQHYASNPFSAVLIGTVLTGVIQSSFASTGLVMSLANAGVLDFRMSAGITLGNNIGTCVTALLASTGTSRAAKRTAIAHIFFNITGTLIALVFFDAFTNFIATTSDNLIGQIANLHTIFNISATIIFIPITKYFARFLYRIVPAETQEAPMGSRHLDKLLLGTPDAALDATYLELGHAHMTAARMYANVYLANANNDTQYLTTMLDDEELTNILQRDITQYLIDLSQQGLSAEQAGQVTDILHSIGDIERIGDHAFAMVEHVEKKISENLHFSEVASQQLREIVDIVDELSHSVEETLKNHNDAFVDSSKALETSVKTLCEKAREGHIDRLERGLCTIDAGIYYLDILSHFERIAEHMRHIVLSCSHRRDELMDD